MALAAVAGAVLLSASLLARGAGVQAQAAEPPGAAIRLRGLVSQITQTIVDQFTVELTELDAAATYQVFVASDSAALGIGGCGTAQTRTVTGVAAQALTFIVYACAVGEGTVTAEVRRAGASAAEASVSQRVTVAALPEIVTGPTGERIRTTQAAAQGDGPALCRGSASRRPIDKPPRSR